MSVAPSRAFRNRLGIFSRILATADAEAELVANDPVLRQALENESRIGRRIVDVGREVTVLVFAVLIPFFGFGWEMLYYEALLVLFWLSGRLRARFARVGRSWAEVTFILFDILLLTFIAAVPNPFAPVTLPTAIGFRFQTFDVMYLLLAFATLANSWRTVWTVGVAVTVVWLGSALLVDWLGHEVELVRSTAAGLAAALGDGRVMDFVNLNDVQWSLRIQEVAVLLLVAAALTLKGWRSNQLLLRQARLAAERANLSRYFPPTIVEQLASQPAAVLQPKSQEIAVMFTDLVGFTDLAEHTPETEIVPLLRRYYAEIERIVFEEGGTLDKYLGDGTMVTFGTPTPQRGNAAAAIRASRRILAAVDALGAGLVVSVGVHFGRATVGDVGPARRLEFAVIGDTVNVASRLEAATREIGVRVVISDAVVAKAREEGLTETDLDGFTPMPELSLRGRTATVDVWVLQT